jgi:hypothetical protein
MDSSDSQSTGGKSKTLRRSSRLSDSRSSLVSGTIVVVVGPGSELLKRGGGGGRRVEVDAVPVSDVGGRSVNEYCSISRYSRFLAPPPLISLPLITATVERRYDEAIVHAAGGGDLAEVTRLYEDGVSLESTYTYGKTALMRVCGINLSECEPHEVERLKDVFHYLLSNGADVHAINSFGESALHCAVMGVNEVFLRELIAAGADLNIQNTIGNTPLMSAAYHGHEMMVLFLIAARADMNTKRQDGRTALKWAVEYDRRSIVALLLMEGASDDGDESFNLAVANIRPYGNRDAWECMKGRTTSSQIRVVLSSAVVAACTTPLVATSTTPLHNFFHKPESLKMMKRIVSFFQGPMDPRFIDPPQVVKVDSDEDE